MGDGKHPGLGLKLPVNHGASCRTLPIKIVHRSPFHIYRSFYQHTMEGRDIVVCEGGTATGQSGTKPLLYAVHEYQCLDSDLKKDTNPGWYQIERFLQKYRVERERIGQDSITRHVWQDRTSSIPSIFEEYHWSENGKPLRAVVTEYPRLTVGRLKFDARFSCQLCHDHIGAILIGVRRSSLLLAVTMLTGK